MNNKSGAVNISCEDGAYALTDPVKCLICLSPFENQEVGSLQTCQHVFCLQCILQWSQTANTCPVDRISFAVIHQRQCPGGDVQKKIKVRARKINDGDEEEEGSSAVICERCGRSDRRHRLLVCTQCDSGYHMNCLTPPLMTEPEGHWMCPECADCPQHADGLLVDISDGELSDLLAEADETPSTSSRLRPSTMHRPGSSTEQRRSQRVQNRAGADPYPRPQTCLHVPKYLLRASAPAVLTEDAAPAPHIDPSNASVKVKKRKRRERAISASDTKKQ